MVYNREEWKKLLRRAWNHCILCMPMEWMNKYVVYFMKQKCLFFPPTVISEHGTSQSECQWTTNHRNIMEIPAYITFLVLPAQHK
jgi:hypothetical protein